MSGIDHRAPSVFEAAALGVFGSFAHKRLQKMPDLAGKLSRAGEHLVPTAWLATVYMRTFIVAAAAVFLVIFYVVVAGSAGALAPSTAAGIAVSPILLTAIIYAYEMLRPEISMRARRRALESALPYALNFMAALANAGVVAEEIFGAIGKQQVYGEVRVQAANIYRDTKLFGKDLTRALNDASRRSPSPQWEEFLQGSINTISTGGNLKAYLLARSEQFTEENRRKTRSFLESLGVMAESYVVVAAAAPLFLIVIISVMAVLSGAAAAMQYLNIIVLLALPIIHAMFAYILRTMRSD